MVLPSLVIAGFLEIKKFGHREKIEQKIKENLPIGELVRIELTPSEITAAGFEINSKEFRYDGHLYDVVKKEIGKNRITFYCINDEEEARIEEQLNSVLFDIDEEDEESESENDLPSFLKLVFVQNRNANNPIINFKNKPGLFNSLKLEAQEFSPPSPPPQFF